MYTLSICIVSLISYCHRLEKRNNKQVMLSKANLDVVVYELGNKIYQRIFKRLMFQFVSIFVGVIASEPRQKSIPLAALSSGKTWFYFPTPKLGKSQNFFHRNGPTGRFWFFFNGPKFFLKNQNVLKATLG